MKKTAVIGLGIIGGSICRALTRAGCFVSGNDLSDEIVSYAKREGYIRERAETLSEYDISRRPAPRGNRAFRERLL